MTAKIDDYFAGQTPLPKEWKKHLLPPISNHGELNEHESLNIQKAVQKYQFGRRKKWPVTDFQFLKRVHKDMYQNVWTWAGEFRERDQITELGVSPSLISIELAKACKDCDEWLAKSDFSIVEMAVRYHHRIVYIHPFPNGNGRFSRFIGDLLMMSQGHDPLPWGEINLRKGDGRDEYLEALKEADHKKFARLIKFSQMTAHKKMRSIH